MRDNSYNGIDYTRAKQRDYDDFNYSDVDLSVARTNKPEEIELAGTVVYVAQQCYDDRYTVSTSKTVGIATVTINEPNGVPIELNVGIRYRFNQPFDRLFLRNAAQTAKGMRIYAATESEVDPFSSEVTVVGETGTGLADVADVSIAATTTDQVLAANASRKSAIISNLLANGTVIRVGTSNAGAARGAEIPIGGSYVHENTQELYVYNPSAGSIDIGVLEETI